MKIRRAWATAESLAARKSQEEVLLAAEGYRFYAQEASEFAAASLPAFLEVLDRDDQTGRDLLGGV